ncbi:MAG: cytochrome c-type biogenesis protein CcmH [Anaerolineales bacterium]|nr:cytochrome c-type biogenesis protein CcmH [Anaerolineales bacterium]
MRQISHICGFLIAIMLFFVFEAGAQSPPPTPSDDEINAIASELYCPVCENVPLDVCGTQACEQWRGVIRDKLMEGWSNEEIKQYFVELYGDRVLATPPAKGFNWLVYLVPPLVILAGVYWMVQLFSRRKKTVSQSEATINLEQEEYISRLEEELKKR